MRVTSAEAALPTVPEPAAPSAASQAPPAAKPESPGPFTRMVKDLGRELDHGEATVKHALRGSTTSDPSALLALQAGIYRYVEAVDLASKLVDRASSAVKTVLQSQ